MNRPPLTALLGLLLLVQPAEMAIPDGYELKWSDEFNVDGAPNPDNWTHELGAGGWGNNEVQNYTDSLDNSRVENGNLVIEVHQVPVGRGIQYTSARLVTREKAQWKYGRIEARAKLPLETGTWPAIWMLADDNIHSSALWPDNGEIDIIEAVGYEQDPLFKAVTGNPEQPNVHGTIHTAMRNGFENTGIGGSTYIPDSSSAFHVYAVNWTEEMIQFEVDGVPHTTIMRDDTIPGRLPPGSPTWEYWPFTQRFFLVMNVAVGGSWGGHFNSNFYPNNSPYGPSGIDKDGDWPQRMEVDYVRAYGPPELPVPSSIPGTLTPFDMDDDNGILIRTSNNPESAHKLSFIDAEDYATFALEVDQAGSYLISTSVATPGADSVLSISVEETGSSITETALPQSGSYSLWESVNLGEIELQEGINTLRMDTSTGGYDLAYFQLEAPEGGVWKGLPHDGFGRADTQSWMGTININVAPWIWVYGLENFIYPEGALGDTFHTDSQWIYIPR